ncbi:MAG: trigger factor [Propionibacteriaceae bacterium]|nr:trigger factor [Propionibacteriaceae bacterium]
MPSTKELISETRVKLTIEVPFDQLEPAIDKSYRQIATQVNIPGFRKGKIPRALIDQRYSRAAVLQEAVNEILPNVYSAALGEHNLMPLGQPKIDLTQLVDGAPVQLNVEVDIVPEFELPDFSKIKVDVAPVAVSDAEVDERVQLLRQRFASYTELERAAERDDVVVIDLNAMQNGEELADSAAHAMTYRVGAGGLVDGLDDAIIGLQAGEAKTFSSTLAGGAHEGEAADITITVRKVQQQDLPALDDDFAQLVSEYDTADEMLSGLRDSLVRMARLDQVNAARDKALDEVVAQVSFALPSQVVDDEFEPRKQQLIQQLSQMGMSVESYLARSVEETTKNEDEFWAQIRERTERGIRAQIILDKVAAVREVELTQEDLTGMLLQKAAENGTTPEEEAKHMMDHGHMQEWLADIRRGKAVGTIITEATVTAGGKVLDISRLRSDGTYDDVIETDTAPATETVETTTVAKPKKTSPTKAATASKKAETKPAVSKPKTIK